MSDPVASHHLQWNVPNLLTAFRVVLIPVFVLVFYLPVEWRFLAAGVIFIVASITDWLDGHLARQLDQATLFGAFLDPVADKVMVGIAMVLLVTRYPTAAFAIPAAIIVGREIAVSALREWMAELGKRASVAVSYVGKVKTVLQMVAISILLLEPSAGSAWLRIPGFIAIYLAALLTLWSMLVYLLAAWPLLTGQSEG